MTDIVRDRHEFGPLVAAEWLVAHLGDADLRVLEASVGVAFENGVREWVNGREAFEAAHIPGAVRADLLRGFSGDGSEVFELPDEQRFAQAATAVGIGDRTRVVVYDDGSTTWATRVWWLLRHYGHDAVAVLDGGIEAWRAAGGPLETGSERAVEAQHFTPRERRDDIIATAEVRAIVDDDRRLIVNALPLQDFVGETSPRPRAGRIPGSINIPAATLLDPETGKLRTSAELERLLEPVLGSKEPAVLHCGAGVSATLPLLALDLIGHTDAVLYEESLNVWAADPANPLETGTGE